MGTFTYSARDKSGKVTKGSLFAKDRTAASSSLSEKGLTPIVVMESAAKGSGLKLPFIGSISLEGKVRTQDKVIFSRQFATMINAGVPITKALAILKDQTESKKFQNAISDLTSRVEGGSTLAAALAEHQDIFNPVYVNMVKAGETGGILDEVLDRLAEQQEKDADIVGKVRGAMIYPGVITTAALGAFFFLMIVIVPKLGAVFTSLGTQLPIYTRVLLAISGFVVKYGIELIGGMAAGVVLLARYVKTPAGKRILDTIIIRSPIIGPIIIKVNVARFARTFGSLMSSGIAVLDALNSTSSAIGNTMFKDELNRIAKEVKNGRSISEQMEKSKLFPAIVSQMVAVGEETGELDKILLKLAIFYEKEVDTVISNITSVIEPILIMIIGTMVGFIVISVFGPLAALNNAVQ